MAVEATRRMHGGKQAIGRIAVSSSVLVRASPSQSAVEGDVAALLCKPGDDSGFAPWLRRVSRFLST